MDAGRGAPARPRAHAGERQRLWRLHDGLCGLRCPGRAPGLQAAGHPAHAAAGVPRHARPAAPHAARTRARVILRAAPEILDKARASPRLTATNKAALHFLKWSLRLWHRHSARRNPHGGFESHDQAHQPVRDRPSWRRRPACGSGPAAAIIVPRSRARYRCTCQSRGFAIGLNFGIGIFKFSFSHKLSSKVRVAQFSRPICATFLSALGVS